MRGEECPGHTGINIFNDWSLSTCWASLWENAATCDGESDIFGEGSGLNDNIKRQPRPQTSGIDFQYNRLTRVGRPWPIGFIDREMKGMKSK